MKKCTYCGKEYPDEATSCLTDGQPLTVPTAPARRDANKKEPTRPKPPLSEFLPTSFTYFLPAGKIGRLAFIFRFLLLNWPFGILVGGIVGALFGWVRIGVSPSELFMLLSICYLQFVAIAKRLHDLGEPTCKKIYWIFVPIGNLVFLITLMFSSPIPIPDAATTSEQTQPDSTS